MPVLFGVFAFQYKGFWLESKEMIFYNEGIFLTTNEGDILNDLKYLESQGVDIVSCGTCLDFFNRKELLQVGAVTNMYDIVERMEKAEKVIKP